MHESVVQTSLSSQFGGFPPTQVPLVHVSFVVHALASLHGAVLFVKTHAPFTQASFVHTLLSLQSASTEQMLETFTHQPLPKAPTSPLTSSATNNFQVPFGFVPLKTDRVAPYGPTGAPVGIVSPGVTSVGLKVPETSDVPIEVAAASSSVKLTGLAGAAEPPVSEKIIAF